MDYERFKEGFQDALKAELAVRGADVELTAHAFCKCNKVNMFKFSICFLLTYFFHPTYCEMSIWKTFCKGHCCPKLARISGTSAE